VLGRVWPSSHHIEGSWRISGGGPARVTGWRLGRSCRTRWFAFQSISNQIAVDSQDDGED
jgi:hypothetical protein